MHGGCPPPSGASPRPPGPRPRQGQRWYRPLRWSSSMPPPRTLRISHGPLVRLGLSLLVNLIELEVPVDRGRLGFEVLLRAHPPVVDLYSPAITAPSLGRDCVDGSSGSVVKGPTEELGPLVGLSGSTEGEKSVSSATLSAPTASTSAS